MIELVQYIKRKKQKFSEKDLEIIEKVLYESNKGVGVSNMVMVDANKKCIDNLRKMATDCKTIGVMISTLVDDKIAIGYSLVHRKDIFDHDVNYTWGDSRNLLIKIKPKKDFGLNKAKDRALGLCNVKDQGVVAHNVPASIRRDIIYFMLRSMKYFKRDLVDWAALFYTVYGQYYFPTEDKIK